MKVRERSLTMRYMFFRSVYIVQSLRMYTVCRSKVTLLHACLAGAPTTTTTLASQRVLVTYFRTVWVTENFQLGTVKFLWRDPVSNSSSSSDSMMKSQRKKKRGKKKGIVINKSVITASSIHLNNEIIRYIQYQRLISMRVDTVAQSLLKSRLYYIFVSIYKLVSPYAYQEYYIWYTRIRCSYYHEGKNYKEKKLEACARKCSHYTDTLVDEFMSVAWRETHCLI